MNKPTDLTSYRQHEREQARIADLFRILPARGRRALDIGARDGYISKKLAERFDRVVALDLTRPAVDHPKVEAVQGDACALPYPDGSFDAVVCTEVLEHIPGALLPKVAREITRVTAHVAVIGVPYRQDIRLGRTTCRKCGHRNPPWGHVNSFDEQRLFALFGELRPRETSLVGATSAATNGLSTWLMDYAGNPYGTYEQEETCLNCGTALGTPRPRSFAQKVATKAADQLNRLQATLQRPHANWIHVLFEARPRGSRA